MGDFNKNQASAPKSEKNKIIMAGALGAVLVVMGLFQVFKSGPQSADAASPDQSGAALAPQLTPDEARASLSEDPTEKLLLKSKGADNSMNDIPHNPFLMTDVWRVSLVKMIPAQQPHTSQVTQPQVTPVGPVIPLDAGKFKLTGIFRQGQKLFAIINGQIVTTGNVVDEGRITELKLDHVTLQHVDSPDGPHLVLTIDPQLK